MSSETKFKNCTELIELDCNCNDCIFMYRTPDKRNIVLKREEKDKLRLWENERKRLLDLAKEYLIKDRKDVHKALIKEYEKMKFQFNAKEYKINYGLCSKLHKEVSFIPQVLQLDTQECFIKR